MKNVLFIVFLLGGIGHAQSAADALERAEEFGRGAGALVRGGEVRIFWSPGVERPVWRAATAPGEHGFFTVKPDEGAATSAFDHAQVAKALSEASGQNVEASRLPLDNLILSADSSGFRFRAFDKSWRFEDDVVTADELEPSSATMVAPEAAPRGTRRNGGAAKLTIENATEGEIEMFWLNGDGERRSYGKLAPGGSTTQNTYAGHLWLITDAGGNPLAAIEAPEAPTLARVTGRIDPPPSRPEGELSPDGKWTALVRDSNIILQPVGGGEEIRLTRDGNRENRYGGPLRWSPDSQKLVAMQTPRFEERKIHIVESSPADQLQPKLRTLNYNKPGDPIRQPKPRLFHISEPREIPLDDALYDNPWDLNDLAWTADSSEFTFVYNQRGHQLMRVVGVRADSGATRTIYEDTSDTFIDYSQKYYHRRIGNTGEFLWASEKSGYNHLYLIDASSGEVRNPVTSGNWNVRSVVDVNEDARTLVLRVVGMEGQDPYHSHFVRVNFDGSGFTRLTQGDGSHRVEFSPDKSLIVATWSRPDHPPVTELRRASDGSLVTELARADDSALRETGWARPERFVAKGRDGQTDIHGIIVRPRSFDPEKKYPVVEDIYAGPHDHFVPKEFSPWSRLNNLAELGFIVVKIDGMGTNWRGKVFHDVAWKNLKDSGFPDRIPWIKSAAAGRPWMDLERVGLMGGSAGGQSTLSGLLHHGDFYKVGVADCGCHDNRMDKIWWNEAWMGWPIDESYADNSNVTHAAKLQGKLMLVVGELDSNVDPASTAQVVHALQKADKEFDFLPIINAGHGAAESRYGKRRRANFLVRHLIGE